MKQKDDKLKLHAKQMQSFKSTNWQRRSFACLGLFDATVLARCKLFYFILDILARVNISARLF